MNNIETLRIHQETLRIQNEQHQETDRIKDQRHQETVRQALEALRQANQQADNANRRLAAFANHDQNEEVLLSPEELKAQADEILRQRYPEIYRITDGDAAVVPPPPPLDSWLADTQRFLREWEQAGDLEQDDEAREPGLEQTDEAQEPGLEQDNEAREPAMPQLEAPSYNANRRLSVATLRFSNLLLEQAQGLELLMKQLGVPSSPAFRLGLWLSVLLLSRFCLDAIIPLFFPKDDSKTIDDFETT